MKNFFILAVVIDVYASNKQTEVQLFFLSLRGNDKSYEYSLKTKHFFFPLALNRSTGMTKKNFQSIQIEI